MASYEVSIEVRHHPRHLDEWPERETTSFKLHDTGDPHAMVVSTLRYYADELEERWAKEAAHAADVQRREDAKAAWEDRQR